MEAKASLLTIPREIRDEIYALVFSFYKSSISIHNATIMGLLKDAEKAIIPCVKPKWQILLICRQIQAKCRGYKTMYADKLV